MLAMKIAILRNFSLYTRNFLLTTKYRTNPSPSNSLFISLVRSKLRFYSSESDSSSDATFPQTDKRNGSVDDIDGISDQELKRQIDRFYEGDEDAIPSIFEAILKRKLAGISDDDEILQNLRRNSPNEDAKEEDFDSDFDKLNVSESDDEEGR